MRDQYLLRPEEVPIVNGSFMIPLAPMKMGIPPRTDPVALLADMLVHHAPPGLPSILQRIERKEGLCTLLGFSYRDVAQRSHQCDAQLSLYQHPHVMREPKLRMSMERINRYSLRQHPDYATLAVYSPATAIEEPMLTFLRDWVLAYVNAR